MAEFRLPLDYKEKVGRAVHEIPCVKRTTLHPMLLYPLYARRMKRGEKFLFSIPQYILDSLPTHSPVLGGYRLRIEWYFNSDANHYGWIDNNTRLTTEQVLSRRHHTFTPNIDDIDRWKNNREMIIGDTYIPCSSYDAFLNRYGNGRGSVMDYMGVTPGYFPNKDMSLSPATYLDEDGYFGNVFNLDFILTYLNIIRCYHINQQFPTVPYVRTSSFADDVPGNRAISSYQGFEQEDLDNLFRFLRYCENGAHFKAFINSQTFIEQTDAFTVQNITDYVTSDIPSKYRKAVAAFANYLRSCSRQNGGLFCSEYMPDLYRNLLPSTIDNMKSIVKVVEGSDGSYGISIEEFRFGNRLQMIYDRISPFGGKDSTVSRTRWGVKSSRQYDIPEWITSTTEYIGTNAIRSDNAGETNIGGESIKSAPGSLAGNTQVRGRLGQSQSFTATEPGTLMAIVSLVPYVDYSMNIERSLLTNLFEDEFSPQMAQRGFEDVPITDYCALPTGSVVVVDDSSDDEENTSTSGYFSSFNLSSNLQQIVGKQVAWLHDIASTNRVHGNFTRFGDLQTWCLVRDYLKMRTTETTSDGDGSAFVTYVDFNLSPYGTPEEWQYMFVADSLKDDNWFMQMSFSVKDISPVGYRFMPTLGL